VRTAGTTCDLDKHRLGWQGQAHKRKASERDDVSSNRHSSLAFYLSMIFAENRLPLFGIMF